MKQIVTLILEWFLVPFLLLALLVMLAWDLGAKYLVPSTGDRTP